MKRLTRIRMGTSLMVFGLVILIVSATSTVVGQTAAKPKVFVRVKVSKTHLEKVKLSLRGYIHKVPWWSAIRRLEVTRNRWSEWIEVSDATWHGRIRRAGGIAEFPSVKLVARSGVRGQKFDGCVFDIELAEEEYPARPDVTFRRVSKSGTIFFLAPYPLKKYASEFETDEQMAVRHRRWADEATAGNPINVKRFGIVTNFWTRHDENLVRNEVAALRTLGFNAVSGISPVIHKEAGIKNVGSSRIYTADPEAADRAWDKSVGRALDRIRKTGKGAERFENLSFWKISDEVSALRFTKIDKAKLNEWFRDYLRLRKPDKLGIRIDRAEFPMDKFLKPKLDQNADKETRMLLYYAAKFVQWWSAKQLRHTSDLIHSQFPDAVSETLLPSHGFLGNAWGPTKIGMSYGMLDIFELGKQKSVDLLSAEDWLGLNHMYGPGYTWTGGQTFGYLNALIRSAAIGHNIKSQALITPSDDKYLRLKAFSALGQGAKSFYFWSFGPTYASTENYWSDLRSEYDGIAKFNRTLEKTEDVLYDAKPVSDPVAILYSVSHDIWHNREQAVFTERRLLWHGLRHLHVQPDFLSEDDLETRLSNYTVLFVADWNIARRASRAIDRWVKKGGILYLSAGAATRDEFNEPYVPGFAKKLWVTNPQNTLTHQNSTYNERGSLRQMTPITKANITIKQESFVLPILGVRSNLREHENTFARFADGKPAGAQIKYGRGKIIGIGFLPMLAYGNLANFKPRTLEEKWDPGAREILKHALDLARFAPQISSKTPVVEINYLAGEKGSALVIANYTYKPVASMTVSLKTTKKFRRATSSEGVRVKILKNSDGELRLQFPLEWTDVIILQ